MNEPRRPVLSREITLGNLIIAVSFLAGLGLVEFPRASEIRVMQSDVARHEVMLKELTASQNLIAANLQVLTTIVNDHLKYTSSKHE